MYDIQADTRTHTHTHARTHTRTYASGAWVLFLLAAPPLFQIQLMLVVGRHRTRKREATDKVDEQVGKLPLLYTWKQVLLNRHSTGHTAPAGAPGGTVPRACSP